jgi:hypothetical protein
VLANSSTHGTTGLTKARLDSRDLIRGQYSLAHEDLTPRVRFSNTASTVASGKSGLPSHSGRQALRARSAHNPEEASDIGR